MCRGSDKKGWAFDRSNNAQYAYKRQKSKVLPTDWPTDQADYRVVYTITKNTNNLSVKNQSGKKENKARYPSHVRMGRGYNQGQ